MKIAVCLATHPNFELHSNFDLAAQRTAENAER
jgi:hypothetical protein